MRTIYIWCGRPVCFLSDVGHTMGTMGRGNTLVRWCRHWSSFLFNAVAVLAANVNRNPVFEWPTEMRDLNALNFKCECVWVFVQTPHDRRWWA